MIEKKSVTSSKLVSIHGGHSGQFCSHATSTLEEVILAYIAKGFAWVGITEHMPPAADCFMYVEERQAGFNAASLLERFQRYMAEGRRLQKKYADQLEIFVGFETESYSGAMDFARQLIEQYRPDYVLGAIHHVADIAFDAGEKEYQTALSACGDILTLYCRYFDLQYEMMQTLRPEVVAHFDLVRIFDPHYLQRWQVPAIAERLTRNLDYMAQSNMILDYNVAALRKGASEPYLSQPIRKMAQDAGIPIVPGDDAHGASMVGAYLKEGIAILEKAGLDTNWSKPITL